MSWGAQSVLTRSIDVMTSVCLKAGSVMGHLTAGAGKKTTFLIIISKLHDEKTQWKHYQKTIWVIFNSNSAIFFNLFTFSRKTGSL